MSGACAVFIDGFAFAQSIDPAKGGDWVRAMVVTDGGAVYSAPDFDAKVSDYLAFKTPLVITKRAVPGQGGLGLFHRVRYKNKIGFMADTDIRLTKDGKEPEATKPVASKKKSKVFNEEDDKPNKPGDPMYFRRYIGATLASVGFSEKFSGQKLSDHVPMAGLRLTGPGILFDGPPLDFNLWYGLARPKYYSQFSNTTGFFVFGDLMALLPFYESGNHLVYYGLGAMYTYTRFDVQIKNSLFHSYEFRMGLDVDLGYGYRMGKMAIRGDVKYYYEKTQYFGYLLSLQTEY